MREIRIYQPGDYKVGELLELSPEASKHVGTVLRMQAGENLTLFCGDDREFKVTIDAVKKKQVIVSITEVKNISRESHLKIHLAQGISKGDRMELVMQKAVELGVYAITPIISERCVVKLDKERLEKKMHQWQSIAIAACEQSGRNQIPLVSPPKTFESYIQEKHLGLKLILHPDGGNTWRDYTVQENVSLMIGPEGGFSDTEVKGACDSGFQTLCLGPRILRTETAAITALSVLQAAGGDL